MANHTVKQLKVLSKGDLARHILKLEDIHATEVMRIKIVASQLLKAEPKSTVFNADHDDFLFTHKELEDIIEILVVSVEEGDIEIPAETMEYYGELLELSGDRKKKLEQGGDTERNVIEKKKEEKQNEQKK